MKILYLSLDPPLDPERVATGNQVRAQGIREALADAGHEVLLAVPAPEASEPPGPQADHIAYRTREELEAVIRDRGIEAVLVAYWALLAHLPDQGPPVVLDFVAPRLLEVLFEDPERLADRAADLIALLPRADRFLVGNRRQGDLLLALLLQAGFDCRASAPVLTVPISTRGRAAHAEGVERKPRVVNAGVSWPWRRAQAYAGVLQEAAAAGLVDFVELHGPYPGGEPAAEAPSTLRAYREMQALLLRSDVGVELGERNTEREFSHSFRAAEYLECGLPLIINSWIPLADLVREYDAGWVIDSPDDLRELLQELGADPGALAAKRRGARALAAERLNYTAACRPLLQYLQNPVKAERFGVTPAAALQSGETPGLRDFVETPTRKPSTLKVLLGSLFKIVFCPRRPDSTPDILLVTRADLFPADHGAAVKIIRTAESLSRQGRDVYLTTDDRREYYRFRKGEMSSFRFPLAVRLMCLPRVVAFARLILKGYPVSNSFLYLPVTDASYIVRAIYLTSRKPIGAYQAEFPAYVRPCRFARSLFGGKVLLVQHNVEYDRIRNQVPDLTERNFRSLKNLEIAMCQLADHIVTVSDNDRQKLIRDGVPAHKIHKIPHGVDLHAFRETPPVDVRQRYGLPRGDKVLVYHGTYSYPPNREAMEVMARDILPRLQRRDLAVSVLAIGSKPPDFPLHEKIHFVGSVENLAEVIPAADLAVVPLLEGGGTRMKILDYFAAGVPVVSTTKGIEGIPVRNGREALIIDDLEAMSEAIAGLLNDPEAAARLAGNAARFVDSLGWDAIARRYLPLLQ